MLGLVTVNHVLALLGVRFDIWVYTLTSGGGPDPSGALWSARGNHNANPWPPESGLVWLIVVLMGAAMSSFVGKLSMQPP